MKYLVKYKGNDTIAILIACHTNSKLKILTIENNIKKLSSSKYPIDIFLIDSEEFRGNLEYLKYNNNVKDLLYFVNTNLICHDKWYKFLEKSNYSYEKFILMNDSFLILRNIDDFFDFCHMKNKELIGMIDSKEGKYHYPDFFRYYNKNGIRKWMNFIDLNKSDKFSFYDIITKLEMDSINITKSIDCLYKVDKDYYRNIHFDDKALEYYLNKLKYPFVKLKKMNMVKYENNQIPIDFNPDIYKSLHNDLYDHNDPTGHFVTNGANEGRKYFKQQKTFLLDYLKNNICSNTNLCDDDKVCENSNLCEN